MKKKRLLLDSYALLAYLKKEDSYSIVKEALSSPDNDIVMNELNVGETFYILARHRSAEQAEYFIEAVLPGLPIRIEANNFERIISASRLKAKYPMSYMDCFAVATAVDEKAALITGDPEFKVVADMVEIRWLK